MKGILKSSEAKDILFQSQLKKEDLKRIWDLCDRNDDPKIISPKGFLRRNEWILCFHLITYAKKGFPVPQVLPPEIEAFLKSYKEANLRTTDSFSSGRPSAPVQSYGEPQSFSMGNSQTFPQQRPGDSFYSNSSGNPPPITVINSASVSPIPANSSNQMMSMNSTTVTSQPEQQSKAQPGMMSQDSLNELEDVIKAYEIISKKYSDEVDSFQSEIKKKSAKREK